MIHFALVQSNIIRNRLLCFNSHSHTTQSGLKHERRVLNFVYNFFLLAIASLEQRTKQKLFLYLLALLRFLQLPKNESEKHAKTTKQK